MALDSKRIQKPARKLRKLLKKMSGKPSPEQVHDFRTNSRQMEATLQAFGLDHGRLGRRILKPLSRLRKRAGKVRDMDVLTAYATGVHPKDGGEQDCTVQLLEYLGARRSKLAKKFYSACRQDGSKLRRRLKRGNRKLGRRADRNNGKAQSEPPISALDLGSQLAAVPRLNRSNLHPFRLKVKELRNVVRLADTPDQGLVDALGDVKDGIGEWHDWQQLVSIAERVLHHGAQCKLVQDLKNITRNKYGSALSQAEQLRRRYLGIAAEKKSSRSQAGGKSEPLMRAAIKMVA